MQKFSKNKFKRIDELLVEKEIFDDIRMARANIMSGNVVFNENRISKAGFLVDTSKNYDLRLKNSFSKYVSRGALKLESAYINFNLDFNSATILDIGASTGGFTDFALSKGAKKVFAVDVGTNQLHWKLRSDKRVVSIENMHIKNLTSEDIQNEKLDFIVMDVSFISIRSVIEHITKFISEDTEMIFLIKPQFEVEDCHLEGGIVRDFEIQKKSIQDVVNHIKKYEIYLHNLCVSPIKGSKGNIEFLAHFRKKYKEEKNYNLNYFKVSV